MANPHEHANASSVWQSCLYKKMAKESLQAVCGISGNDCKFFHALRVYYSPDKQYGYIFDNLGAI